MYHLSIPIKPNQGITSERKTAAAAGLSRGALRDIFSTKAGVTLRSLTKLTDHLKLNLEVFAIPRHDPRSDFSTISAGHKVLRDGFNSWKIYFMDFVDEFRRTPDPRLIMLPPPKELDERLYALTASIVCSLSSEVSMQIPDWASRIYFLKDPWFPSGSESLKAMNILESPLHFRKNNIFVGSNFLERT